MRGLPTVACLCPRFTMITVSESSRAGSLGVMQRRTCEMWCPSCSPGCRRGPWEPTSPRCSSWEPTLTPPCDPPWPGWLRHSNVPPVEPYPRRPRRHTAVLVWQRLRRHPRVLSHPRRERPPAPPVGAMQLGVCRRGAPRVSEGPCRGDGESPGSVPPWRHFLDSPRSGQQRWNVRLRLWGRTSVLQGVISTM